MNYMSFDIGGTFVKYGVVTEAGEILVKGSFATPKTKELLIAWMMTTLNEQLVSYSAISGIGISAPGIVAPTGELITAGGVLDLYGVNLKTILNEKTGLPVSVENDANAAAIAEQWVGNAQGCEDYLCIVLGTGIGGGIVINNKLYKGRHGMSGEFGWLVGAIPATGEIETASMNYKGAVVMGLVWQYVAALKTQGLEESLDLDAREIFKRGEEIAQRVLAQYYADLAWMLLNLVSLFDPEKIVIGGGISANKKFMAQLRTAFDTLFARHTSLANLGREYGAEIVPAKLLNDAGIIGAAYIIHNEIYQ